LAKIEASTVGNDLNAATAPDGIVAFAKRNDVGRLDEVTTLSDEKFTGTLRDSTA
jgi:hypothetical protein